MEKMEATRKRLGTEGMKHIIVDVQQRANQGLPYSIGRSPARTLKEVAEKRLFGQDLRK